jgi:hypothetical protein
LRVSCLGCSRKSDPLSAQLRRPRTRSATAASILDGSSTRRQRGRTHVGDRCKALSWALGAVRLCRRRPQPSALRGGFQPGHGPLLARVSHRPGRSCLAGIQPVSREHRKRPSPFEVNLVDIDRYCKEFCGFLDADLRRRVDNLTVVVRSWGSTIGRYGNLDSGRRWRCTS